MLSLSFQFWITSSYFYVLQHKSRWTFCITSFNEQFASQVNIYIFHHRFWWIFALQVLRILGITSLKDTLHQKFKDLIFCIKRLKNTLHHKFKGYLICIINLKTTFHNKFVSYFASQVWMSESFTLPVSTSQHYSQVSLSILLANFH